MSEVLFPTDLAEREWVEFEAEGFSTPVAGVIHRGSNPPLCGMPLGGIDTGCLDLEATGLLGYCTIFNSLAPRRGRLNLPFLGVSVGLQTWVLTTLNMGGREGVAWGDNHNERNYMEIRTVQDITYWGHYPVADLEYHMDSNPASARIRGVWRSPL